MHIQLLGQARPIPADRLLVQRAITNLVSNAIRHAFDNSTITIAIESTGTETSLAVTNAGEAIAPAHLDRVFDRFFRGDPGRSREAGAAAWAWRSCARSPPPTAAALAFTVSLAAPLSP